MLKELWTRTQQGHRTVGFPHEPPILPDRLRGRPKLDVSKCPPGCAVCAEACPTDAISIGSEGLQLDLGCREVALLVLWDADSLHLRAVLEQCGYA